MTRLQFLLGKLAEEANEVGQMALKTQQFGLHEIYHVQELTNAERTHLELDDLMAIIHMLNTEFDFGYKTDRINVSKKIEKVNKYAKYSEELGILITEDKLCDLTSII